ncbi:MAG: glucose-6-phosphate dehydrogenase (NADP(+)), partial [bacterium]
MERPENCVIVIFGASGDLTKRKLLPSLFDLYRKALLPKNFAILGIGRTDFTDESYREKVSLNVKIFVKPKPLNPKQLRDFLKHVYYQVMDSNNAEEYAGLKERISAIDEHVRANGNYLYYLATSPSLYEVIAENLGGHELQKQDDDKGWKRIVFEKPFGFNLTSAQKLNQNIQHIFNEDQIYRIDHYLGKETVQNILTFRFANGIFEPLWNRNYIHHVEVTAAESIGVENRGGYYEGAGALRDMVQNHLLQVVATVAMEPPSKFEATALRNEKVKVFQSLC